jgi:hypothetical protein
VAPTAPHLETGTSDALAGCDFNDPFGAAHTIRTLPAYANLANGINLTETGEAFGEDDTGDKPKYLDPLRGGTVTDFDAGAGVAACIQQVWRDQIESLKPVDLLIGAIVQSLSNSGHDDDTVIIFTSDNGFFHGQHRLIDKIAPYEEAIKVPLIVYDTSAPSTPKTLTNLIVNTDLAPTVMAYAAGCPTSPAECVETDGDSFKPLVRDDFTGTWRSRFLLENYAGVSSIQPVPPYFGIRTDGGYSSAPNVMYAHYDEATDEYEYYPGLNSDPTEVLNKYSTNCNTTCRTTLETLTVNLESCAFSATTCQSLEGYVAP